MISKRERKLEEEAEEYLLGYLERLGAGNYATLDEVNQRKNLDKDRLRRAIWKLYGDRKLEFDSEFSFGLAKTVREI